MKLRAQADIRDMEVRGDTHTALDLGDRVVELLLVRDIVDNVDTRQGQIAVIQHAHGSRRRIILKDPALLTERGIIDVMGLDALEFEVLSG